ncbi:unnamed protein product [Effrenium voratum]|nr:unnamed protein product [Effrenium voratum]
MEHIRRFAEAKGLTKQDTILELADRTDGSINAKCLGHSTPGLGSVWHERLLREAADLWVLPSMLIPRSITLEIEDVIIKCKCNTQPQLMNLFGPNQTSLDGGTASSSMRGNVNSMDSHFSTTTASTTWNSPPSDNEWRSSRYQGQKCSDESIYGTLQALLKLSNNLGNTPWTALSPREAKILEVAPTELLTQADTFRQTLNFTEKLILVFEDEGHWAVLQVTLEENGLKGKVFNGYPQIPQATYTLMNQIGIL